MGRTPVWRCEPRFGAANPGVKWFRIEIPTDRMISPTGGMVGGEARGGVEGGMEMGGERIGGEVSKADGEGGKMREGGG